MRHGWLPWLLALVILIAAITLATAPFFDLTGRAGPLDGLPGTLLDVKPTYGALLVAAGVVIGILGLVAVGLKRGWVALIAAAVAFVAGISLESARMKSTTASSTGSGACSTCVAVDRGRRRLPPSSHSSRPWHSH